ncbi:MAG: site-2 protease family protein [Ruminiclostridium sp.]|nr:site-2 protease family protein [Ruminiclostridium sp.]
MIRALFSAEDPAVAVITVFSYLVILLIVFPIHECAHAFMAKFLGDHTAEEQGRITLNPLAHLDPVGTIGILLFGVGWAKPVPVQPYRARKVSMRAAMALTAAAGPLANIVLSLVAMIIGKLIFVFGADTQVTAYLTMAMFMIVEISLYNGVFNLLPIPPFDGSRVFFSFLPNKIYFGIMKYERYIMYGMLFLFYTGILSLPFGFISNAIYAGLDFITGFIC